MLTVLIVGLQYCCVDCVNGEIRVLLCGLCELWDYSAAVLTVQMEGLQSCCVDCVNRGVTVLLC